MKPKEYVEMSVGNYTISFNNKSYLMDKVNEDGVVRTSVGQMFLIIKSQVVHDELTKLLYDNDKETLYNIDCTKIVYGIPEGVKTESTITMQCTLRTIRTKVACDDIGEVIIVFKIMRDMKDMV